MNVYLTNLWNKVTTSFWLLPAAMTVAAVFLSFITLSLDNSLDSTSFTAYSIWQGGAEGARELLSTIAGSIITITGVVFSITTVALTLTSNQYGSSLLPSFMRDLGTKIVLGTFISTSIYALLILRTIKGESSSEAFQAFTPNLSITISLGLAILSLSMLIYFIHHLSVRIQSTDIIAKVSNDLMTMIESSMESLNWSIKSSSFSPSKACTKVFSSQMGYLQAIDYKKLLELAEKNQFIINIDIRAGQFIRKEMPLAKIFAAHLSEKQAASISNAFIIGKERSPTQDIEYGIDQLVTIALRSLSLSKNDPFTANLCIDHLGAALCLICQKNLNLKHDNENSYVRLISKQSTFKGLIDASFNQIRQYGSSNPSILIHLLETLSSILNCSKTSDQRTALKKHALMIKDLGNQFIEEDKLDLVDRFNQFNLKFENLLHQSDNDS